jgi:hypothetical protein
VCAPPERAPLALPPEVQAILASFADWHCGACGQAAPAGPDPLVPATFWQRDAPQILLVAALASGLLLADRFLFGRYRPGTRGPKRP